MRLYFFGDGTADGSGALRHLLGAKGAELAQMARLGVPVPPGFTIPAPVCQEILDGRWPDTLDEALHAALARLGACSQTRFGDPEQPLIVSVRAGSRTPLPGALKSILNVGLTAQTIPALVHRFDDEGSAWDTYNRALQQLAWLIYNIDPFWFEEEKDAVRRELHLRPTLPFDVQAHKRLATRLEQLIASMKPEMATDSPFEQLRKAIRAAILSYNEAPAQRLREHNEAANERGIAINIQQMVFGNLTESSGTGVVWTRDRRLATPGLDGDFLFCAQGEEVEHKESQKIPVVAVDHPQALVNTHPESVAQLRRVASILESHYRDMQRIEFTLERGKLWILETSNARRGFAARMQVAVDLVHEGLITEDEALHRIEPKHIRSLLHPTIDPAERKIPIAQGLATSPGAASGFAVFSSADAERFGEELNMSVILITDETAPDDIRGVQAARGVITERGGLTSHAAVVTRQMGKPSVVGCNGLHIDSAAQTARFGQHTVRQGDYLTIDGSSGEIFAGELALKPSGLPPAWAALSEWADHRRRLRIYANADSAGDARLAMELGAEGIGLVRSEHMFFGSQRLRLMRQAILAQSNDARRQAMEELMPFQRNDLIEMLAAVQGRPLTIRLLDPPLHEFLPQRREDLVELGETMGMSAKAVHRIASALREQNPMLGHRGCRLAVSWPMIYELQARAIFEAMAEASRQGIPHDVEILVPLVSDAAEMRYVRTLVETAYEPFKDMPGMPHKPIIGSMIEVARACLLADEIAKVSDFISFGTNDLTQSVYGLSRDDASTFLPAYLDTGLMTSNPFIELDQRGVGWLIELACHRARAANPAIRIGLCGEQGADSRSIAWLERGVVDYISCNPYRVPIARLAAGRAAAQQAPASEPTRHVEPLSTEQDP